MTVPVPVGLHAVPVLPEHEPVPGTHATQPKPLAQRGVAPLHVCVLSVPALQMVATLPWHVMPLGEQPLPPLPLPEPPPLPLPLPVSGNANTSGKLMSSEASMMVPLPLPELVASSPDPPSSPELPELLPVPLPPPLLLLPSEPPSVPGAKPPVLPPPPPQPAPSAAVLKPVQTRKPQGSLCATDAGWHRGPWNQRKMVM